jgi:hypothetical protein
VQWRSELLRDWPRFVEPVIAERTAKPTLQAIRQSIVFHDVNEVEFRKASGCVA